MERVWLLSLVVAMGLVGCASNPGRGSHDKHPDGGVDDVDGSTEAHDGDVLADGEIGHDGSVAGEDGSVTGEDGSVGCTDECDADATRCSGTQIQTCERATHASCLAWSRPRDCSGADVCSADQCRADCVDACTVGDRRCASDDGYQVCEMQSSGCTDWSAEDSCPSDQMCGAGGACVACMDGAQRCGAGSTVQECTSGTWLDSESCAFGCSSGACIEMITCTPGTYRCNANSVETCNSSGTAWLYLSTCAVSCSAGLCTGACTPGETRCNGMSTETCNTAGTAWTRNETCTTFCARGACALDGLEVASNRTLDGDVYVDGDVVVRSGATITSPTGVLTIHATSIVVENGASISVAPTGDTPDGRGGTNSSYWYGGGGSYGSRGPTSYSGVVWGGDFDSTVAPGSRGGGAGSSGSGGGGGLGGGVLRLIAPDITLAGQITANGANGLGYVSSYYGAGGGSGGGILVAGNHVRVSGTISAVGGTGGPGASSYYFGQNGGNGRIRLLHGASVDESGSVISGTVTRGVLPPIEIYSSTHPNPNLFYNDGFATVGLTWSRPFTPLTGYYWFPDNSGGTVVPSPSNAWFASTELISFPVDQLTNGTNIFRFVSVTPTAEVGGVYSNFRVQLNTLPPTIRSTSHPSPTSWSSNHDVFLSWTLPHTDENYRGVYYVWDHNGDTVPTTSSTFLPLSQKQILLSGVADGVWALHVVSADTMNYLTHAAAHYRVMVGADPGNGTVFGQITDSTTSAAVRGAEVSINGNLFGPVTTNSTGNYNLPNIPAGSWDVTVQAPGYVPARTNVTVTASMSSASNIALTPITMP